MSTSPKLIVATADAPEEEFSSKFAPPAESPSSSSLASVLPDGLGKDKDKEETAVESDKDGENDTTTLIENGEGSPPAVGKVSSIGNHE